MKLQGGEEQPVAWSLSDPARPDGACACAEDHARSAGSAQRD